MDYESRCCECCAPPRSGSWWHGDVRCGARGRYLLHNGGAIARKQSCSFRTGTTPTAVLTSRMCSKSCATVKCSSTQSGLMARVSLRSSPDHRGFRRYPSPFRFRGAGARRRDGRCRHRDPPTSGRTSSGDRLNAFSAARDHRQQWRPNRGRSQFTRSRSRDGEHRR